MIHSAALTKHYGDYQMFYAANVQATRNLLEFCLLTQHKDFHYISTLSVLRDGHTANCIKVTHKKQDQPEDIENYTNFYVKTKLLGELETIKYREKYVQSGIYRMGNLAVMLQRNKMLHN